MLRRVILAFLFMFFLVSAEGSAFASVPTTVFVDPAQVQVELGQTFKLEVKIDNVSKLQGFDFMIFYDTSRLDCLAVEEGLFLSGFGNTFVAKTEINDSLFNTLGRVWMAVCIYGTGYSDGNGTLATVTFKATGLGEGSIDLYSDFPYRPDEVKLTTCGSEAISNKAVDGHFKIVAASNGAPPEQPPDDPPPPDPPTDGDLNPDMNEDGLLNIIDITIVAKAFGSTVGDSQYREKADLDHNGFVDILDIALVARLAHG